MGSGLLYSSSADQDQYDQPVSQTWVGLEPLEPRVLLSASSNAMDISAASFLGGLGEDAVRGAVVQDSGTIVLAANISDATPGGLTPTLLNGATADSDGAIIRLSQDGQTVLSVTRLADKVLDLAADDSGNLYVAQWEQGFSKINATADTVLWSKTTVDLGFSNVQRIDAGPSGYSVVLGGGSLDNGSTLGDHVRVFDPNGNELGGVSSGKWKNDVAIDEASETVVYLGYRNATDGESGLPVQIAYYRGIAYDGTIKYTGYDWSGDPTSDRYLNSPTNNMADTRGYRCSIGDDGYLYLAFESAGGNNIFRYDPFDINQSVNLAGGDGWHTPYNISAPHITYFGKYEAATGAFVNGNHFLTRLSDDTANTARVQMGNIHADEFGQVYLVGSSAWGLPLSTHPLNPAGTSFNPGVNGNYLGGGYVLVMKSNFYERLFCTRLTGGWTHAVASGQAPDGSYQVVFGGSTGNELYVTDGDQMASGGGTDGWYGVIPNATGETGNNPPTADFTLQSISSGEGSYTMEFDATATNDPDGDPMTYVWHFGDGSRATGQIVQHTFESSATATVTLTAKDDSTGWSTLSRTIGPPSAAISVSQRTGTAPVEITFDAGQTTDPDNDISELTFEWDFGDGTTATGQTVSHTFQRGGVFNVRLTATDPYGGSNTTEEIIGIAAPGGISVRLDFQYAEENPAPGYIGVPLVEYDPTRGYGWQEVTSDFRTSGYTGDALYSDYHSFSKYPSNVMDGTFLLDIPDGTYTVLARFSHKDSHSFPGVAAEGTRETGSIYGAQDVHVTKVFDVTVEDGQLETTFIQPYWFVSGLEVFDTGSAMQPNPTDSFVIDPNFGESPLEVGFRALGEEDESLTYEWDFGDGAFGTGREVSHTYSEAGDYTVTLTVSGAGTSGTIVNFGGDYVSSRVGFNERRILNIDADGDGEADDSVATTDFGIEPGAPFIDVSNGTPSGRIYGGIAGIRIGDPTAGGFADARISNSETGDFLNVRDQQYPEVLEHRAVLMWAKEDFLNGAGSQSVYFDSASEMSVSIIRWESLNAGRWVVSDGGQLYVSQATFSGTGDHSVDPNITQWAPYNPSGPYQWDFDQDAATFTTRSFTDIRAVGVLLEQDGAVGGARVWYQVDGFSVDAAWGPAEGTVNVVEDMPVLSIDATDPDTTGTPGEFVITRTGDTSEEMTVNYTVNYLEPNAADPYDYQADPELGELVGSIVIPAGSSSAVITITPWEDAISDGDDVIRLDIRPGAGYTVSGDASATMVIPDFGGPFVDFGADYLSSTQTLRPSENGGAGTQTVDDFNNDGVTDAMRSYEFSTTTPVSPPISDSYDGPSATFYGGVVGIGYGATSENFDNHNLANADPYDYVNIRFQTGAATSEFHTAFVWAEEDFLVGESPKILGDSTTMQVHFKRYENLGSARWLLGDGEQFYVSQQTFTGSTTWQGQDVGDSMWAVYSPSGTDIAFDAGSAVFDVALSDIEVREIGFITTGYGSSGTRHWIQFDEFSVRAGDNLAPTVEQVQRVEPADERPDILEEMSVVFTENVAPSIEASDLTLYDLDADEYVDLADAAFSYDRETTTGTWDVSAVALGAGNYEARLLAADIADRAGNQFNGGQDYTWNVTVAHTADATLDGWVDDADFQTVSDNWDPQGTGNIWADGDVDDDGAVGNTDFASILANWNAQPQATATTQQTTESTEPTQSGTTAETTSTSLSTTGTEDSGNYDALAEAAIADQAGRRQPSTARNIGEPSLSTTLDADMSVELKEASEIGRSSQGTAAIDNGAILTHSSRRPQAGSQAGNDLPETLDVLSLPSLGVLKA
ncbi:MAG: PKD domain-containing protein [Phycisphaerae bacterium]